MSVMLPRGSAEGLLDDMVATGECSMIWPSADLEYLAVGKSERLCGQEQSLAMVHKSLPATRCE